MSSKRISVDLEESLYRRFKARLAFAGVSMTGTFVALIRQWLGTWGGNLLTRTLEPQQDLRTLAEQYYGDPELYWAIAHFNDIAYPSLVEAGQEVLVPEPGTTPVGLAPNTSIPWGVTKVTVSMDIDTELYCRFRARAAFECTSMTVWLYEFVANWTGHWPARTITYTVTAGDTLRAIAYRFYGDETKYLVLIHLNGILNPTAIQAGQRLVIPEPTGAGQLPIGESPYIFGIHDRGGEHLMADGGRKGWVLITEGIGRNPYDDSGEEYSDLEGAGYGVIVRLNHGYSNVPAGHYPGTIPERDEQGQSYREFAARCGNFVQHSRGCHIWIIGNEMNHPNEWPGGERGQMITPAMYGECFKRCREEIRRRVGHEDDQVVVGAIAPWPDKAKYAGNDRGDWVKYLADVLPLVRGTCDGIALHTYTHGPDPAKITARDLMQPPFDDRYFEFRTYRQFMDAIPASMRTLPVYITETDQNDPWALSNTGWVQTAYAEIDRWNQEMAHQKIRCLLLYRWQAHDQWSFANIDEVKDDFRAAVSHDYRWWR